MEPYLQAITTVSPETLYNLPHKHKGTYPTGFVLVSDERMEQEFPFTVCPLLVGAPGQPLPGSNPHDVIVRYTKEQGSLESVLYTLYERYKETLCERTEHSEKRYIAEKTFPPRKIIIPCFQRKENLVTVLKRFQTIDLPAEGYRPPILLVEHSPFPELESIATEHSCEYLWIFLDPRIPLTPLGQFNKALCYDKAFLSGTPATWYLFHDNDVIVPKDFWCRLDANLRRTNAQFLQPYTHRCLFNLKPVPAQMIRDEISFADEPLTPKMHSPLAPGAPGGSLYLSRERYLEAGGHDPQFCWGYGPEDTLFYHKLELLEPIAFADDPPIEMRHLWHPPAAVTNPLRAQMDFFVKGIFVEKPLEEKRAYMRFKQELLERLSHHRLG
jgi:hypothetical protein